MSALIRRGVSPAVLASSQALQDAALADRSDAAKGAGRIGFEPMKSYLAGTIGASFVDGLVNVLWFFSEAERVDVRTGAGLLDVGGALDAATAWALASNRSLFMPNGMYKRTTPWAVPPKVGIRAESRGQPLNTMFDPANAYGHGVVIYKAHSGHGITRTGGAAYEAAMPIYGVAVSSHRTNFPAGAGFVMDKVSGANLFECEVWGCGGDGIIMGVTAGDVTGQNVISDCYVNNCLGTAYRLRSKWTRGWGNKSDGCSHHLVMLDAPETHWEAWHGEGFRTGGIRLAGANASSRFTGKGYLNNTGNFGVYATFGIRMDNVAGNNDISIEGAQVRGSSVSAAVAFTAPLAAAVAATLTAAFAGVTGNYAILFSDGSKRTATLTNGSAAVAWVGAVTASANAAYMSNPDFVGIDIPPLAVHTRVAKCEILDAPVGINDGGTERTRVVDNHFYRCGIGISAASNDTRYTENNFDLSWGADIDHVSQGGGIWSLNGFGKGIRPSASGAAGAYGTNLVKDNRGLRTRNGGKTVGTIASGVVIPHGLLAGAVPARFYGIPTNTGYTNFRLGAFDGTNVSFLWDGGGTLQIQWFAEAACEVQ